MTQSKVINYSLVRQISIIDMSSIHLYDARGMRGLDLHLHWQIPDCRMYSRI